MQGRNSLPPGRRRARAIVSPIGALTLLLVSPGLLVGCSRKPAAPAASPTEVKVITVQAGSTEIYREFVGQVRGSQEVDLRARVSGVLLKKHFADGSVVQENELLFTIDPREYRARLANAQAQLASAQANYSRARQDVDRYAPLVAEDAISKQVYDNAVATASEAAAQVEATQAVIREAQLSVDFANVRSPFKGRIGAAQVFEGALVTAGQTVLATISQDDPAWVYFSVSETDLLEYQRRTATLTPNLQAQRRRVRLTLADGTEYPHEGNIDFAERAIDPTTGTYQLRATFPNAEHQLLPGLFGRVRLIADERTMAITVPDRAVQQQLDRHFVYLIGPDDKVEMRPVTLGPRLGSNWVIEDGLRTGDQVIVDGIQKVRPGSVVTIAGAAPAADADAGVGAPAGAPAAPGAAPKPSG